ncbi:MAG: electron transport complex subunit RsxC [Clostridia bacterium]|nr:electron transport complex subunit RsxC [Clostridia bacterium]
MFGKHLFPGGIHPAEGTNGKAVNQRNAITELPAPKRVVIPLSQHIGAPAKAIVKKGDRVLMGQMIGEAGGFVSAPVHASVSGIVADIVPVTMFNGSEITAIVIENDFRDEWAPLDAPADPESLSPAETLQRIRQAGIVGMGGATFPTAVKLTIAPDKHFEKLVINGAECEPYLTADHRLMLEQADAIIDAVSLILRIFSVPEAIIGVEENKPDAIDALRRAASGNPAIRVQALPVRYPQGGEKQLIHALTGRTVPAGKLPIETGCVVMNAGTAFAVHEALREGKPLIRRVTTVGGLVAKPNNWLVRIGTPVRELLRASGGTQKGTRTLISGGPMMGTAFTEIDIPVTKGCSGILALGREAIDPEESPCIRCGRCMRACPMNLQPVRMDHAIRARRFDEADKLGVMNCIECGACTFVCPATRMLTQSFRAGKRIVTIRRNQQKAREEAEKAALAAKAAAEQSKTDGKEA